MNEMDIVKVTKRSTLRLLGYPQKIEKTRIPHMLFTVHRERRRLNKTWNSLVTMAGWLWAELRSPGRGGWSSIETSEREKLRRLRSSDANEEEVTMTFFTGDVLPGISPKIFQLASENLQIRYYLCAGYI